ncbi:MAG: ATP-binding protein [Opitutaceae bacterium]|nr:ATP-binding protein [Opitutaceae bacterium]
MIRLLFIADDSRAEPLTTALSSAADFHLHRRPLIAAASGALAAGAFDACLLAPGQADAEAVQQVAATRAALPRQAVIVILPPPASSGDQSRFMAAGADLVLLAPVDTGALAATIRRLAALPTPFAPALPPGSAVPFPEAGSTPPPSHDPGLSSALEVLRDFSQVLGYSLDYRQLTHHFVLKLREVIGVTRIAIFLEPGAVDALPTAAPPDTSRLPCAAAIGLPADLAGCFMLSRTSGIGRQLTLNPQILRAAATGFLDPGIAREFEVLGGQVAIPVHDRERTLGAAVLGGRITGGEFPDAELLLIYHLLEELGLAVKNSWLHHQLVGSHRLFAGVLDAITIGALVAGPDLSVLYANRAIVRYLGKVDPGRADFADLPVPIAQKLHEVVEKGADIAPFFHEPPGTAGPVFRVTILPLRNAAGRLPQTAMVLLEDFTQIRTAQRAEIEASNLRLVNLIARRFAHEIRNSLVPLTTHQQLFDAEIGNAEFRESLKQALARETHRIQRFTEQMLFLAQTEAPPAEVASLEELLRSSFENSRHFSGTGGELEIVSEVSIPKLRCHRPSLAHAFEEIFLNGLQSAGPAPRLTVAVASAQRPGGGAELVLRVRDSGRGFAPESAGRAAEPFFTTRNTGVGLGLTVAQRVIEAHQGRLEIHPRTSPTDSDLVIHLPFAR